jgi:hypothetical protein
VQAESCVTMKGYMMTSDSLGPLSGRTAIGRFSRLSVNSRVNLVLEKPGSAIFLPPVSITFNCIGRMLSRHNIKSVSPLRKIPAFFGPWMTTWDSRLGVYSGQVYNGQTGHSTETRIKEHPHKSAVTKHNMSVGHHIKLQYTSILSTKAMYMDKMI